MDRLHSMRVFSRVVDEGSFARAARELNLSPAVVTRLVADLEEHLGSRLINRTTRRLSLTDTGELYLERVRHILTEVEEAEALATASTAEPRGHLRVLCPPAFAVHQIAKHLPKFRALYPRVTLELSVPGPVETVDENFDVSILTEGRRPLDGNYVARRLARSEVILCAAPEYLDRRGRPQHPKDIEGHESMVPPFMSRISNWGPAMTLSMNPPLISKRPTTPLPAPVSVPRVALPPTVIRPPSLLCTPAKPTFAVSRMLICAPGPRILPMTLPLPETVTRKSQGEETPEQTISPLTTPPAMTLIMTSSVLSEESTMISSTTESKVYSPAVLMTTA